MIYFAQDGFFENPQKERQRALESEYQTIDHNGLVYHGICPTEDEESVKKIESIVGMKFTESEIMYRRYLPEDESKTFIHNDSLISAITGVVFLTEPQKCSGGLAFWRHRMLGWDSQPLKSDLQMWDMPDENPYWDAVYKDGFHEGRWIMEDYVPMSFNRIVLFTGSRFHSRYPINPIGDQMEDCRLIKVFFLR